MSPSDSTRGHARPGAARPGHGRATAVGAVLAAAALLAFAPALRNGFVVYDDPAYLLRNARIQEGFTPEAVRWAFTSLEKANWHPLTWLSHMLDFQLFGARAGGHHAVSALLHAASSGLLLALLLRLTGSLWRSALAAALFALHPLRVESVAWASERKDVLSLLFGLGALLCYGGYARRRAAGAYAGALALFACSLMSKPMLVTLPLVLLLLDWWPLGRWPRARGGASPAVARLLLEKLPFAVLAAGAAALTMVAHERTGAVAYAEEFPLAQRIGNALTSVTAYLGKMAWPADLAAIYPYNWDDVPWWRPALAGALVAAATAGALLARRGRPALAVGWAWYLVALAPVLGLIQTGSQSMADRYTYLPGIGIAVAAAWGLAAAVRRATARNAIAAAAAAALASLGAMTAVQTARWRTSETLFRHTVAVTRNNVIALPMLGLALREQGRWEEANAVLAASIQGDPLRRAMLHRSAAEHYAGRGMPREAAEQYRKVLELRPYDEYARERLRALEAQAAPAAP